MKELKFKTNLNCGGCVSQVTPVLNTVEGVSEWKVDTTDKNKILSVTTDRLSANQVIAAVEKAGFKAEEV